MTNWGFKRNIGIDIDGVVADMGRSLVDRFGKEKGFSYKNITDYNLNNVGISDEELKGFLNKDTFKEMEAIDGSVDGVNKLYKENTIKFISSRNQYDCVVDDTYDWLISNGFKFDSMICFQQEKLIEIKKQGIDLMIEDNPHEINKISEEIHCITYNQPWNQNVRQNRLLTKRFRRCKSWGEIVKYL